MADTASQAAPSSWQTFNYIRLSDFCQTCLTAALCQFELNHLAVWPKSVFGKSNGHVANPEEDMAELSLSEVVVVVPRISSISWKNVSTPVKNQVITFSSSLKGRGWCQKK